MSINFKSLTIGGTSSDKNYLLHEEIIQCTLLNSSFYHDFVALSYKQLFCNKN